MNKTNRNKPLHVHTCPYNQHQYACTASYMGTSTNNNIHVHNNNKKHVHNNNIHVLLHETTYNFAPTTLPPSNATVAPLT
jgi:hypothetical protein